jgi:hypothetical protein
VTAQACRREPIKLLAIVGCFILAGCGGSGHSSSGHSSGSLAQRVCGNARQAAGAFAPGHEVGLRIANSDPSYLECLISARRIKLDVVAQASAQAWTEYDTTVVHQAQAFGPGSVSQKAALPQHVQGMSGNAAWLPQQRELVTTNGTQSTGGSYVTVTVTRGPNSLPLVRAVAIATLAVAPRGPSPGAPPS